MPTTDETIASLQSKISEAQAEIQRLRTKNQSGNLSRQQIQANRDTIQNLAMRIDGWNAQITSLQSAAPLDTSAYEGMAAPDWWDTNVFGPYPYSDAQFDTSALQESYDTVNRLQAQISGIEAQLANEGLTTQEKQRLRERRTTLQAQLQAAQEGLTGAQAGLGDQAQYYQDLNDQMYTTAYMPYALGQQQQQQAEAEANKNILATLTTFLQENGLPSSLLSFIQQALAEKKPYAQIVAELRQTPEYKAAYPENDLRQANGLSWIPEAEIRAYRDEARRLASEYLGVGNMTNEEIAHLISNNKSLREWEHDLQTYRELDRWGPAVKYVLAQELGYEPTDDLAFKFLHPDYQTPELDRAYQRALLRGQPTLLGLGIRPEEEAAILEQYGISPEQAFKGYQGIVAEMPRSERLAAIEAEINRNTGNFPPATQLFASTPFATLFRAIQLQDAEAIRQLQVQIGHEVARWQAGGGIAQSSTGAAVGLLTASERAQG